jgi:hypothetical protein
MARASALAASPEGNAGLDDVAAQHGSSDSIIGSSSGVRETCRKEAQRQRLLGWPGGGAVLDSAPVGFQPARRKKVLDGSVPCGCEKNGVKSFTALARPS